MKTQHTPGPWRTDGRPANECAGIDRDGRNWQIYVEADNSTAVCRVHGATAEEAENDANRIVACVNACAGINPEAVPDLLAACIKARDGLTGMSPMTFELGGDGWIRDALDAAIAKATNRATE